MSNPVENAIREKRTIEATKKNIMGPAGKFGIILHAYGTEIMRQGSGLMDVAYLDDPYDDFTYTEHSPTLSGGGPVSYRDEILDASGDSVYEEGLLFDGLGRGLHLEIVYWYANNEITVSYKGYTVYKEIAGELESYAPFPDWEDLVDRLYRTAREKVKKMKVDEEAAISEQIQRKKQSFWQYLRYKWGV